jgi:hypothetical protein
VRQNERRPVLNAEPQERALELVAVCDLRQFIVRRPRVRQSLADLGRTTTRAPNLVLARMDEEPVKPGIEPVRIA